MSVRAGIRLSREARRGLQSRISGHCVYDRLTGCWNWSGARNSAGLPTLWHDSQVLSVPRLVWRAWRGCVPWRGLVVYRRCGNSSCVCPGHLGLRKRFSDRESA